MSKSATVKKGCRKKPEWGARACEGLYISIHLIGIGSIRLVRAVYNTYQLYIVVGIRGIVGGGYSEDKKSGRTRVR